MRETEYSFTCSLESLPIPLPVSIALESNDPGFSQNQPSNLTTLLHYSVAPAVINLLPDLAPNAFIDVVECGVGVEGGAPTSIEHTAQGLPFAPVGEFDSDELMTDVTPDADASQLLLDIRSFRVRITGIPLSLVPAGEVELVAGQGDCGALELVEGSSPIVFSVEPDEGPAERGGGPVPMYSS